MDNGQKQTQKNIIHNTNVNYQQNFRQQQFILKYMNQNSEVAIQNTPYNYENLLDLLREKDNINMALVETTKRQQFQIDQLLIAAQQKNQQHIRRIKYNNYAPYLVKDKFLILKLLEYGSDIYLPEYIELSNIDDLGLATASLYKDSSSKAVFLELQTLKKQIGKIFTDSPSQLKQPPSVDVTEFKKNDENTGKNQEKSRQFFYNYQQNSDNHKFPSFGGEKSDIKVSNEEQRLKKLEQKLLIPQQQKSKNPTQRPKKILDTKSDRSREAREARDASRNKYKVIYIRN